MEAWVVYLESYGINGRYNKVLRGIFSSREKAVEFIKSFNVDKKRYDVEINDCDDYYSWAIKHKENSLYNFNIYTCGPILIDDVKW